MGSQDIEKSLKKVWIKKNLINLIMPHIDIELNVISTTKTMILLAGNREYFENMLDLVSNLLIEKGLDETDNPNEFGADIETIIDIISAVTYS